MEKVSSVVLSSNSSADGILSCSASITASSDVMVGLKGDLEEFIRRLVLNDSQIDVACETSLTEP